MANYRKAGSNERFLVQANHKHIFRFKMKDGEKLIYGKEKVIGG